MEVAVVNVKGEDTGRKVSLSDKIFGIEPNDHAIYLDVKYIMANSRQGTHKSKERGEITGSRKKVKRQKGTGTARFGDIKNPIFRGGGRIFGPRPRTYNSKLNRKLKALARRSALTYKAKESSIAVLEDFTMENAKTKEFINILKSLELNDQKTLFVLKENDKNVFLSSRNIPGSKVLSCDELNTYDLVNAEKLVITESSFEKIENLLG